MFQVQYRQMFRSNGLLDDFVLRGNLEDYEEFANAIKLALDSGQPTTFETNSTYQISITESEDHPELFTSLQNEENMYSSMNEWQSRSILRVQGSSAVLGELIEFLISIGSNSSAYVYLSEYSERLHYSKHSPEWRLEVEST